MDQDLDTRLKALEQKVDDAAATVRKMWRMYQWTLWITIALFVVPLIVLAFVIPQYLSTLDIGGLLQ